MTGLSPKTATSTKNETHLAPPPSGKFVAALQAKGVAPRELGLELQIVFNKGAVMVLPAGVNEASGLKAALDDLGLSSHNVVAVGDAENDHAFMRASAYAVAVANALPAAKDTADLVTKGARGAGVMELIELVTKKDADAFGTALKHGAVQIGR